MEKPTSNPFNKILKIFAEIVVIWVTFPGPFVLLCLAMATNLYLMLKPLLHAALTFRPYRETFSEARIEAAKFWVWYGSFYHAHQFIGMSNIPNTGPAVIVYYHGAIPIDYALLLSRTLVEKKRIIRFVRFLALAALPPLTIYKRRYFGP